jgi:hypothetical protein
MSRRHFVTETFCYGDVLLQRHFVTGDVSLRRRCVYRRFVGRRFVKTFCMSMCADERLKKGVA